MPKTCTTISIDSELLDAAREEAVRQRRSLSSLIEYWISQTAGVDLNDQPQDEKQQTAEQQ